MTKDNVDDTVIADGFYTVADICTAEYADACNELASADPRRTLTKEEPVRAPPWRPCCP